MGLSGNQKELIHQLQNESSFMGRYTNLNCVNVIGGKRRGVLSLVFQGHDSVRDCLVAIKVMDPDRLSNAYRIKAFEREPDLLQALEGRNRCLQLVSGLEHYIWEINHQGAQEPLQFQCGFFVVEWLEEDVDEYFYEQDKHEGPVKLEIFRNILLAVEATHHAKIFHRDIKVDNIRVKSTDDSSVAVLIDFGTATHFCGAPLESNYSGPVGAPAYSPPEAFVGFSGDRDVGRLSDSYALGALLFNLFNHREFRNVQKHETRFDQLLWSMKSQLATESSLDNKRRKWQQHIRKFKNMPVTPEIAGPGNTLPPSISQIIKRAYSGLINFDFLQRTGNLSITRRHIDTAIRVLSNQKRQEIDLSRKRDIRKRRQEKIRQKQKRIDMFNSQPRVNHA